MNLKSFDKALILLLGVGMLLGILKKCVVGDRKDGELTDSERKELCAGSMNSLFGKGVDSVKICDCLLPGFYELIKTDPVKVDSFKQKAFFMPGGGLNDSVAQLLRHCISKSVIDTNAKLDMGIYKERLIAELKKRTSSIANLKNTNTDDLFTCIVQKLDGNITIKEYFGDDYWQGQKFQEIVKSCMANIVIKMK